MISIKKDRRRLLKKLATTTASLPFLSHLPSLGAAEMPRKRFITMFSPNGTIPEEFFPNGGMNDFTFNKILKPLEPIRDELIIMKGLNNKIPLPGDGHQRGMGGLWTAAHLTAGDTVSGGNPAAGGVDWASNISIDQYVANKIGNDTRFKSLEYGVKCGSPDVWKRMCYKGSNQPLEPEVNPIAAFDRLYANGAPQTGSGPADDQQSRAIRLASVLDGVLADFNRMRNYLSAEDKVKLERHTEAVRNLEKAIEVPELGMECDIPTKPGSINLNSDANIPALGKIFLDLMVSAFACDQAAVGSMQWSYSVGNARMPFINVNDGHHAMSHEPDDNQAAKNKLTKVNAWYAEQFLYLVQQLKATPDPAGGGSLLDNTYVIWGNELGKGNSHTRNNIPFVSAGSAQGYFKTGRFMSYNNFNHSRLLASIGNAYGGNLNGFGDYQEGDIPNLRA